MPKAILLIDGEAGWPPIDMGPRMVSLDRPFWVGRDHQILVQTYEVVPDPAGGPPTVRARRVERSERAP